MLGSSNGSNGSDTISCTAVVGALCGELSPDRTRLVGQAFMSLDTTGSGHVSCTCCTCCTVGQGGAAVGQGLLFVRNYCLSGTTVSLSRRCCCTALLSGITVCQGLLFVRNYCLSGTTVSLSGTTFLFVRDYCLSGTTVCQELLFLCQGLLSFLSGTTAQF